MTSSTETSNSDRTARRPLTVVQTLPALDSGGVERGTLEIAVALVAAGHRSVVVSRGGRLVDRLVAAGSEHVTMPIHRKSPLTLLQVRPFRRLIAEVGADIVHARSRVPAWVAWLALRRLGATARPAFVTTVHGLHSVNAYSAIMTRGDVVIAVSDSTRRHVLDRYPRCPPERIRTIHRGVSATDFPEGHRPDASWLTAWRRDFPALGDRRVITLPGRITRLKGHETFVRLVGALRERGEPVVGLVVGGAEPSKQRLLTQIDREIAERGLGDDIVFTGVRGDIREIFAVSDVVVSLSSRPESFGRTAVEALSLGVPVVGWAHGGIGEILARVHPDGAVPLGDFDGLVERVRRTLVEPRRRFEIPIEYRLETMCAETLALYAELAAR